MLIESSGWVGDRVTFGRTKRFGESIETFGCVGDI